MNITTLVATSGASVRLEMHWRCATLDAHMDEETKAQFEEHLAAIKEYEKQLGALRDDLKVALEFSHPSIVQQARHYVDSMGSQAQLSGSESPALKFNEMVKSFVERNGLFDGGAHHHH
jgi:hypothetical protein